MVPGSSDFLQGAKPASSAEPTLADKVRFLGTASSYPHGPKDVTVKETLSTFDVKTWVLVPPDMG